MIHHKEKNGRNLGVLILAGGEGTRMESTIPKVLHHVGGRPMLFYTLRLANALKPQAMGVVVGYEADRVKAAVNEMVKDCGINRPINYIVQKKALG